MAMLVVATTFVSDARSKMLSASTSGEPTSKVNRPSAFNATSLLLCVMAMAALGNAFCSTASVRILKALEKILA
jgi:hypothetical protein